MKSTTFLIKMDKAEFTYYLPSQYPLLLSENAEIGVKNINLWNTFPNISGKYNNNKMRIIYKNNPPIPITFPKGMYEIDSLSQYLNNKLQVYSLIDKFDTAIPVSIEVKESFKIGMNNQEIINLSFEDKYLGNQIVLKTEEVKVSNIKKFTTYNRLTREQQLYTCGVKIEFFDSQSVKELGLLNHSIFTQEFESENESNVIKIHGVSINNEKVYVHKIYFTGESLSGNEIIESYLQKNREHLPEKSNKSLYLNLGVNKSTLRCFVRTIPDVKLDFTDGNLHKILGLEPRIYSKDYEEGEDMINITSGVNRLFLRCNQVKRYYQPEMIDVLYDLIPYGIPGEAIIEEKEIIEWYPIKDKEIRSFEFKLTDEKGNLIDLQEPMDIKFCVK